MKTMLVGEYPMLFDRKLAATIGVSESIVLQQIHYWISKNQKKNINYKDGRYWTFNSIQEWHEEEFYFWSESTIRRIFASLEKKGLLIIGNFNRNRFDRTKWYTIDYEKLEEMVFEGENEFVESRDLAVIEEVCENEDEIVLDEGEIDKRGNGDIQDEDEIGKRGNGIVQFEEEIGKIGNGIVQDEEEIGKKENGIVQDEEELSRNDDIFIQCENILRKYKTAFAQNKNSSSKIGKCSCSLEIDELSQKEQSNTKDYKETTEFITKYTTQQLPKGVVEFEKEKEMLKEFLGSAYTEEYFERIKELLKNKGEDSAYLQEKIEIAKSKNLISKCGYLYSAIKNNYKDIPSDIENTLNHAHEVREKFLNNFGGENGYGRRNNFENGRSNKFEHRSGFSVWNGASSGRNRNRFKNFEETVSKYTEEELEEKIREHNRRKSHI